MPDYAPNGGWVYSGWGGKVNALNSRMRRAKFKRMTLKEIKDER